MSCRRQFSICFPSSMRQTGISSDFFQHNCILRHKNSLLGSCFQITNYPVDGIVQERETLSKDIRNLSYSGYRNCCVLHDSSSQKLIAEISVMLSCVDADLLWMGCETKSIQCVGESLGVSRRDDCFGFMFRKKKLETDGDTISPASAALARKASSVLLMRIGCQP